MNNYLIILLLFLSVGFSQQEYNINDLIEMDNGLTTIKFSDEPITGKVYGYYGEVKPLKKVYMGNLRNGKKKVDGSLIIIVMEKKSLTIISRMGKKMDYKLNGMKMDRRRVNRLGRMGK